MKYSQTIRYKNELEADVRVTVEPWARQYLIEPQAEVKIVLSSDEPIGEVEVWSSSTGINFGAPSNTSLSVLHDGEEFPQSAQV